MSEREMSADTKRLTEAAAERREKNEGLPPGGTILGCNDRWYLPEFASQMNAATEMVCVRTVLVAGDIGDYAAYQGIGSKEYVARHGDKVRFAEACCHFPGGQLEESRYRR